jgi:ribosomal protein L11 methyltransferase
VAEKNWLEVSLLVDGEIAEAVAEVLARHVPDGVVIESTQIIHDPEGEGHPGGPMRVVGYLPMDTNMEELRQRIEEGLWYLSRISPMPGPQFRYIQEVNWVEAWKEHYHPIPVGRKLMIIPAWLELEDPSRLPIRIDPGMAFGTGTHPTTQLCLVLAENHLQPGEPVIDVGCGSGILSIAALRLGAPHALGVDIEEEAITASRQNATLNQVERWLETGLGSVAEVHRGLFSISQAPVVFANILAPVLVRLLDEGLGQLISPGGVAILSGILAEQEESVLSAAQRNGLHLVDRLQSGDWVALCLGNNQASGR